LVWKIGRNILNGQMVNDLIKPIDFQQYMFFFLSGNIVIAFITTFIPTLIIIYLLTEGAIVIGINLIFFIPSVMMAIAINYFIDFMVSTICLYTMSIWGINIMKEVIALLLSGATIPLAFFPDTLRKIVACMPFQAIYNIPLQFLINRTGNVFDYTKMLCLQIFWVVVTLIVSRVFWKASLKIITVNGG
jgi:ABC-type uncharacterized transport system permease subunit